MGSESDRLANPQKSSCISWTLGGKIKIFTQNWAFVAEQRKINKTVDFTLFIKLMLGISWNLCTFVAPDDNGMVNLIIRLSFDALLFECFNSFGEVRVPHVHFLLQMLW